MTLQRATYITSDISLYLSKNPHIIQRKMLQLFTYTLKNSSIPLIFFNGLFFSRASKVLHITFHQRGCATRKKAKLSFRAIWTFWISLGFSGNHCSKFPIPNHEWIQANEVYKVIHFLKTKISPTPAKKKQKRYDNTSLALLAALS